MLWTLIATHVMTSGNGDIELFGVVMSSGCCSSHNLAEANSSNGSPSSTSPVMLAHDHVGPIRVGSECLSTSVNHMRSLIKKGSQRPAKYFQPVFCRIAVANPEIAASLSDLTVRVLLENRRMMRLHEQ